MLVDKLHTMYRLGLLNVWRVFCYRVLLKFRLHPTQRNQAVLPVGDFIAPDISIPISRFLHGNLKGRLEVTNGAINYFGKPTHVPGNATKPPDWHNPFHDSSLDTKANRSWWLIDDFDESVDDIKCVWEFSRFDWLLPMAQSAAKGNVAGVDTINEWVSDWVLSNTPYKGRNWKCGQEASIRVLHLAACLIILDQTQLPTKFAKSLIEIHLRRIASTIGYAIGQANNHGTSEAAALYVGGTLVGGEQGKQWHDLGRRYLENRCSNLIEPDGTFSQYSVNYHRLMLDTFSFCESWRRLNSLVPFSSSIVERLSSACEWLRQLVDEKSGDVPNMGANDGAHILNLSGCGYRDFRPSVQWASVVFKGVSAYACGPWDEQLKWLGLEISGKASEPLTSATFDNGGLHVLRGASITAYLRYPRFRFRPSQADALHCDVWINGENVLRDAGSYSYGKVDDGSYFSSTAAHNTIEFDNRDQMPRYGRFLFGQWLNAIEVLPVRKSGTSTVAQAGYRDFKGARQVRHLELFDTSLVITDVISGYFSKAVLRWRLNPVAWKLDGHTLVSKNIKIRLESTEPVSRVSLLEGFESRFYLQKQATPIFELELFSAGKIVSTVEVLS